MEESLFGVLLDIRQGGKYYSLHYASTGYINDLTLPIEFKEPLFATAISDSRNDDIIPHVYAISKTTISISMDETDEGAFNTNVYLLAIGIA